MTRIPQTLPLLLLLAGACGPGRASNGAGLVATIPREPPPQARNKAPATSEPRQRTLDVGDKLPTGLIEGLAGSPAASFQELYGRALVLEFFAYWCVPCARSVPHMNELQEKYATRGLSIVGVTNEGALKTEPWITSKGVRYAHGYDPSGELHRLFQVKAIPFAVLIDPFGTVLWSGAPGELTEERVERALAEALPTPVWEWPPEARGLAGPLMRGEYAAALERARALPATEGLDLPGLVQARIAALGKIFDTHVQRSEYVRAVQLGQRLERELAGLPEGERIAAALTRLREDPVVGKEVDDSARMTLFEERAAGVRKVSEARRLRDELATFVEGGLAPKVAKRAEALLGLLERELEKFKK